MGDEEDIKELKTKVEEMEKSATIGNKLKEIQPIIYVLVLFFGIMAAWFDMKATAEKNSIEMHRVEDDIEEAKTYTHTKFNELKIHLDNYRKKADSTHDEVLKLKEQTRYTLAKIDDQNELLKQLLNKK